jgi:hypothetical protein
LKAGFRCQVSGDRMRAGCTGHRAESIGHRAKCMGHSAKDAEKVEWRRRNADPASFQTTELPSSLKLRRDKMARQACGRGNNLKMNVEHRTSNIEIRIGMRNQVAEGMGHRA